MSDQLERPRSSSNDPVDILSFEVPLNFYIVCKSVHLALGHYREGRERKRRERVMGEEGGGGGSGGPNFGHHCLIKVANNVSGR
ncbi:hypothetical protein CRG98_002245 [Punica granatum]|uniref:Uncharacterized protein n=1 Tax=Punica granatum TaxID=22663 RepID=A0A2I0L9F8_PUNGR|nr:hypothetical protein CRG98_002245 [Punica granatum]